MSNGVISDIESGRSQQPRPRLLRTIALVLEIDERELFVAAGYPYMASMPELPVYLRTKYGLSDDALAHMTAQWAYVRDRYDIATSRTDTNPDNAADPGSSDEQQPPQRNTEVP